MPQPTLDPRRPPPAQPALPWYKTDLFTGGLTLGVIVAANGWLVCNADKGWGFWLWVFVLIPVGNAILAALLLACSPIVRIISGMSASLHVWVTLIGCGTAVFVDAAIIFGRLYGC